MQPNGLERALASASFRLEAIPVVSAPSPVGDDGVVCPRGERDMTTDLTITIGLLRDIVNEVKDQVARDARSRERVSAELTAKIDALATRIGDESKARAEDAASLRKLSSELEDLKARVSRDDMEAEVEDLAEKLSEEKLAKRDARAGMKARAFFAAVFGGAVAAIAKLLGLKLPGS